MNINKGFFSLLSCGLILALFGLLVRFLSKYIGNFTQVSLRMWVAVLIVLPYFYIKKTSLKVRPKNMILFSTLIISFPLYIIFFTLSIMNTKLANALFYLFTSSLLTSYILGFFYFKEKINYQKIMVAILLIFGIVFLAYPFNFVQGYLGIVSGIVGGFFWGLSNATRKFYVGIINRWLIILYQMIIGGVIALLLAIIFKEFKTDLWTFNTYTLLLIFGIGLVLIQFLLFTGFENFKLNLGSIVLASQLVFAQIIGIFVLHEIPTFTELIGCACIIIAIILSNLPKKNLLLPT